MKDILRAGISYASDPLDKRRLVFFNYLILFCVLIAGLLSGITAIFGFATQAVICLIASALLTTPLVLNKFGYISFSKFMYLTLAIILVTIGTFINLEKGFYVESENMLLALMAISMFLIDGWKRNPTFWTIFAAFLFLKIASLEYEGTAEGFYLALAIINNSIVGIVLFAFLAAFRNILVRALDRNVQHERRLFSMIDNVPVFLALVDTDGSYILANQKYAENFQIDKRTIVGKTRTDILPGKIIEDQKENFARALKGESVPFLQETQLPSGVVISANGKYEPVFNDNGEVESITICVDDVTPLVKAQQALQVANETKDKLFSIVAHDIRSPLNMFQTFLNVSEQSNMSMEDFFTHQQTLKERLSSLTGTVDELLEWSRMQLGGINAYPAQVNVSDVVGENIDLFNPLIKKKNIDLQVNTPADASAWIDENHFKVALRNLIHNAIKYTNGGGSVHVQTDLTDTATKVSIIDTGIGMNSATIDSIIKKEIQDSQAGTEREMGTGVGLSLSLGLLEKNNCKVSVSSELNKGTRFEIEIPRNKPSKA